MLNDKEWVIYFSGSLYPQDSVEDLLIFFLLNAGPVGTGGSLGLKYTQAAK